MQILFSHIHKVFVKHNFVFKELFTLIKAYIRYGKEFLLSEFKHIETLFEFAIITLYNDKDVINGAIYASQLLLITRHEVFTSNVTFQMQISHLLQKVSERLG